MNKTRKRNHGRLFSRKFGVQNNDSTNYNEGNLNFNDFIDQYEAIYLPIIENLDEQIQFRPMAIPKQLQYRLQRLTRMPFVLFLGSIISYIMRPNDSMARKLHDYHKRINFRTNDGEIIVGVHVRRTDKLNLEGDYYSLEKYMEIVERIYRRIDVKDAIMYRNLKDRKKRARKIYLATDDENVWLDEVPKYIKKGYEFLGDINITRLAAPETRDTLESFEGFLLDLLSLSSTDYLVCTFSSQVCRLAYELMQIQSPNGHDRSIDYYSLDDPYYFGGQISHRLQAIMDHNYKNENGQHTFKVDDTLGIESNLHNGYNKGDLFEKNTGKFRCNESLSYPRFKVIEKIDTTSFKAFE